jgi:tetratricopeptide (TPR) repeat protein
MLQDAVDAMNPGNQLSADLHKLELPPAPAAEQGLVKAWNAPVSMLTYMPAAPDPNPLFLEKRVYQGSSGRVYPLPVIDYIERTPHPHSWDAVHIENEFLRLMILPAIGGRIHIGVDKRTGYDFFYRQNVIKPALVGLAGPWISGGVEFNWPQHHRPATFMPVETVIERDPDGSVTIWCSDHDPMVRMKGMHGICLHPGKAYVEVKVRLYNRTLQTQTFLWWANVATRVHEQYQSFFPKDVRYAADHAKRAATEYPLSQGLYYGIDYGERARSGVPSEEMPGQFVPDGSYPPNDLGWYANIPVPTSYMIVGSQGDFFGGYDHRQRAGTVAYANHHIAPGKKQWTWGNHDFGYAWDRSLTDNDGPYVELMSGVYTDNQPDFSFLAPGETKTFSQYWYPIGDIGVPDLANLHAALRVENSDELVTLHLQVTENLPEARINVRIGESEIGRWTGSLTTADPLHLQFSANGSFGPLEITLTDGDRRVLRYAPDEIVPVPSPVVATEPPLPEELVSNDELFLNGLHLEQYRHPTRAPEIYWHEAIKRDPGDSRCNLALGRWHLNRGEFHLAEKCLLASIARLTLRNPNPPDGEPHYTLGLVLSYLQRPDEAAYQAFYKSTWNAAWRAPAYQRLAEIDCVRADWTAALDHLDRSLRAETDNLNARNLRTLVLRQLGRTAEAAAFLEETRALDPLDIFSNWLATDAPPQEGQLLLDLAFDLVRAGFLDEALSILAAANPGTTAGIEPVLLYLHADILHRLGHPGESAAVRERARHADPTYVFPSRLEEFVLLGKAVQADRRDTGDAHAPYYLGNLLYDRRRYSEAIKMWERAVALEPSFVTPWRNLGIGYFNVLHDPVQALQAFARARAAAPSDARILYEYDQLLKRTGHALTERLAGLEANAALVEQRDDLSVELASLYNNLDQPRRALDLLLSHEFQPWEGGEGLVLSQYVRANVLLAHHSLQCALQSGEPTPAIASLVAASNPPKNLSEAKHLLMNLSMIDYWLGVAHQDAGNRSEAERHWTRAARQKGDFQQMQVQAVSENTYWSALALRRLGREQDALHAFRAILDYSAHLQLQTPKIDYFATSLPAMLLFEEDLAQRQTITARFLEAQARLGLGDEAEGLRLLEEVLAMDNAHTGAIDLLRFHKR